MNSSRFLALCMLVLAGSFAGGYAANRVPIVAHAQDITNIRGTSFVLTDSRGRTQATLRSGDNGPELTLKDTSGNARVEITDTGIIVRDKNGAVTWRSPRAGFVPAVE